VAAQLGPALTAIGPVRVLTPALSGVGDRDHVALTFDDGPDPRSTPAFLRLLREHEVNATFFLLGEMLARSPALGRRLVESGHEVAVHGWDHRCLAWRTPRSTYEGLARARDLIATRTGCVPRWFRPPYGVLTLAALQAARRLDLTPVLWTSWGRDWTGRATAESVLAAATRGVAGGGVVLLHDSTGGYAAPGAWRATLGALPGLVEHCRRHELGIGRLDEHGLAREPRSGGTRRGRARS
jgi:peptidoglycan/xylan/chitin deacetylase (PgdA/CDA1 family)